MSILGWKRAHRVTGLGKTKKVLGKGQKEKFTCYTVRACQVVLVVKNSLANAGGTRNVGFHSWIGKIPWRRA